MPVSGRRHNIKHSLILQFLKPLFTSISSNIIDLNDKRTLHASERIGVGKKLRKL